MYCRNKEVDLFVFGTDGGEIRLNFCDFVQYMERGGWNLLVSGTLVHDP